MPEIALRPATLADIPALAAVARDCFDAAFGHLYKPGDLASFFAENRTEARYRDQLRDPGTRILLAEDGGRLVGYCLVELGEGHEDRPDPQPERPAFLSQLYCLPEATGRGVGAAMIDWAFALAREWGADALQLSVFSENFGAQRFYARYGFEKVADIDYWVGNHRDDEFLYELRL